MPIWQRGLAPVKTQGREWNVMGRAGLRTFRFAIWSFSRAKGLCRRVRKTEASRSGPDLEPPAAASLGALRDFGHSGSRDAGPSDYPSPPHRGTYF